MKKRSLPWNHAAGLSLHLLMDNFFRAVITVVLLGVCCAAFGVCICAYGHDYMGTQAEIFRAYEGNTVALSRFYDVELRPSQQDCVGLDTQDVAELEETFGGRAALIFHDPNPSLPEEYLGPHRIRLRCLSGEMVLRRLRSQGGGHPQYGVRLGGRAAHLR